LPFVDYGKCHKRCKNAVHKLFRPKDKSAPDALGINKIRIIGISIITFKPTANEQLRQAKTTTA